MKLPLQIIKDGEREFRDTLGHGECEGGMFFPDENTLKIETHNKTQTLALLKALKAEAEGREIDIIQEDDGMLRSSNNNMSVTEVRGHNKAIQHQIDSYNELIAYLNK